MRQGAQRTGTVIPLDEIGTDRHRLDMWTASAVTAYNAYGDNYSWKFANFRKTNGYTAVPLDGIWLTGPYLHNGSVPTLADLLEPVAQRPTRFWRGYDLFDAVRVGFVSDGEDARRVGTPLGRDRSLATATPATLTARRCQPTRSVRCWSS
jgi:cytochrome c peroxidase